MRPSCEDHEARWGQALTPARRALGRLAQSRALLEDEFTGKALCRFDTQALAAVPERARQVLEVAEDFFLADPDTRRKFTSRERPLPEDLPERRPHRCVSLGELVSAWPFRQSSTSDQWEVVGPGLTITHSMPLTHLMGKGTGKFLGLTRVCDRGTQ